MCKDASLGDVDPDTATGEEGDIQTKCFRGFMLPSPTLWRLETRVADRSHRTERDSTLSYSVVMIFIVLTSGLLIGAVLKERMGDRLEQAGLYTMVEVGEQWERGVMAGSVEAFAADSSCSPAPLQRFRRPTRSGFRSMGR